jgi:AraC family transcriptional regulator of adaptative response/methylated-DNA-[protein]-cysteine methyltransferase
MQLKRLSRAVLYAAEHYQDQPGLDTLAAQAGLSPGRFQRAFQAAVGLSPKNFVAHLTARQASGALRRGHGVLQAALDAGLSGPGRLHDLMVKVEGATPGQVATRGRGLLLHTALVPTACGALFAAAAPRGLAYAAFVDGPVSMLEARAGLQRLWPWARIRRGPGAVAALFQPSPDALRCWVPGTPFQLQVWRALVRLRPGRTLSYQGLARAAKLAGPRAVANAVAANPVALLIPCHRVIRASGAMGGYHWGEARKRALLALEGAATEEGLPAGED